MKVYDSYTNTFYDNSERQQTVVSDRTKPIPTMVYPQVDGITPTIVVEKGHWIKHRWDIWECSLCHNEKDSTYANRPSTYCPDCGHIMEKVNDDGEIC